MPPKPRHRGYVEQRPNGTWRAVVYAGVDPLTGKERRLRQPAPDEKAAKVELTKLLSQVDERRHSRTGITVTEMIDQWLGTAEHGITTRERYDDLIRLYINPHLGGMAAAKVDPELLEKFYARLGKCRELCNGRRSKGHTCRPLANNTVRKIHSIFSAAFDQAVRWRHLGVNEAALARQPSFERSKPDPPSAAEAAAVLSEAWGSDPEWGLFLWLTMLTGSRRGEMSALQWQQIDLERGVLTVMDSNAHTKAGVVRKKTKTDRDRTIALDAGTVALLAEHRERCERQCRSLKGRLTGKAFVFSQEPDYSEPLLPRSITQRYRRLADRLELRSTRLHALRHYTATELIAAGVDLRTVGGRLGHADGGVTTLRVYAGWVTEADRRAADTMAALIPKPDPSRRAPRSPYEHIAAALREQIASGALRPGDQLPTMVDLGAEHQVSVGTAHRAVALLRDEGLVRVARGQRAVVVGPAPGSTN